MDNLLRFNFKQKYCIFDYETEGLSLISSRPWQLSWATAVGKKVESTRDHFLSWPDLKVSEDAARITGFSMAEYNRRKEDPFHVFPKFWQTVNDDDVLLIGHNIIQFDNYITNITRIRLGLPSDYGYMERCLDTNALSIAVKNGITTKPDNCSLIEWQFKLLDQRKRGVKTSMSAMLKHFNIPFDSSKLHNAEYDIRKNFELFWALIQELDI